MSCFIVEFLDSCSICSIYYIQTYPGVTLTKTGIAWPLVVNYFCNFSTFNRFSFITYLLLLPSLPTNIFIVELILFFSWTLLFFTLIVTCSGLINRSRIISNARIVPYHVYLIYEILRAQGCFLPIKFTDRNSQQVCQKKPIYMNVGS